MLDDDAGRIKRQDCEEVSEFLEQLELAGLAATYGPVCPLIFRGVSDADAHKLVPTALRTGNAERVRDLAEISMGDSDSELSQRLREIRIAGEFRAMAN